MQLGAVLCWEGHVGQHVVLAVVYQRGELGPARAQLIGDVPPGLVCSAGVGLQEGLTDCGGDHGVLALGYMRQSVAHPMHATALPASTEDAADRVAQAVVSVGDDQLDAFEATLDQALQKSRPERLGLRGTNAEPEDLASAFGRDRHGDYRRDRDDAAAVTDFEVGG